MSGFFGMMRGDGGRTDERLLQRIAAALEFRGPEGTQTWVNGEWGGCFAFLRKGSAQQTMQQPVISSQRYFLVGDVRLDGKPDLLAHLKESAGTQSPETDEELLLRAWRHWGEGCLQHVIGDFAFALWDAQEKCLWCARDFVGARPFFYSFAGGIFYFTNTLEVLRCVPEIPSDLDDVFVGDFLLAAWSYDPARTVFREVRRLPPGHLLKFGNDRVEVKRFLTLPVEEPLHLARPQAYVEAYRDVLQQAVSDRLPEGNAALYLSGGLDSSSVCAVAARIANKRTQREKLKAFTISWRPLVEDQEPEFAQATANFLGLAHEVMEAPGFTPYEDDVASANATPEPSHEAFLSRARRQSASIAEHARVVLAGDGGDDILTGQAWPYFLYLRRRGDWAAIAKIFGGHFLKHGRIPPLRGGFRTRIKRWVGGEDSRGIYPVWLTASFEKRADLKQRWKELARRPSSDHPVHPEAHAALHSAYWAGILEGEDAGWTRVPLETRAPLLDLRLLRFLLRVPPVPWCVNKEITRRAMKGALPDAVLTRPKTPLPGDPLEACLKRGEWRPEPLSPPKWIHEFVKWQQYIETLEHVKGSLNSEILRPLSLARWLKGIENT